jgi:hypothetical protein
MACRISELVLGCRDPEVLAQFWCEVLDFVVLDREEDGSLEIGPREGFGGPQPTIILSRRDEPKPGKSRLHIDVNAADRDQDAELERLLKLGRAQPTSARPARNPGTFLPTPRAMRSACSRPASTRSDGSVSPGVHARKVVSGDAAPGSTGCEGHRRVGTPCR